ncbi:MAG: aspartate--tRNA ligase [Chlorobi bacterium]|nr:aspartate--tRNA ligase [Chlorobiota bacterium]
MYRTHTCGELRAEDIGKPVVLSGWVQRVRDLGAVTFVDLRDRYGITQLAFSKDKPELMEQAKKLGREYVVRVEGKVRERESKNPKLPTGDIEIDVDRLEVLNPSALPPFLIEDQTDGGEELRAKYRYLDIRRRPVQQNLIFRSRVTQAVRNYLTDQGFIEVETPYLIKSTPEGARDFVVPSRLHPGQFYALPQSPQTFKQLLMVGGMDKYMQIVKCFRDEDLRADRQPEFTQIDCEMSFVTRDDVLRTFEGLIAHLLHKFHGIEPRPFPRMTYDEAMARYGTDKPDIRFGMELGEITPFVKDKDFKVFAASEYTGGIAVPGGASFSRKQIDGWTEWVKRPQVGAKGLVWVKYNPDGTFKSSVDKFFGEEDFRAWAEITGARPGDLMLFLSGPKDQTRKQLGMLRLELANRMGLRKPFEFAPLWITDFPLLEWDEETGRYHAMHHPFTAPLPEDEHLLDTDPARVRANAYDLVLNGNEIGGGSIRIHRRDLQEKMFELLGFTPEEARRQFGFLMKAFEYGAPPHGGIAIGLDRLVALMGGEESIRDFIAFPKNTSGRDVMIDAPDYISEEQLRELHLKLDLPDDKNP